MVDAAGEISTAVVSEPTVPQVLLPGRTLPDGASPLLRLLQVGAGILESREAKALLHSLSRRSGAHPAPPQRVKVGRQVGCRVPLVVLAKRPAPNTVLQAEHTLVPADRCRAEPLDDELPLGQADGETDFSVTRGRELPIERNGAGAAARFASSLVHPERTDEGAEPWVVRGRQLSRSHAAIRADCARSECSSRHPNCEVHRQADASQLL